eukprot:TRINITY_DN542_c0_g1_i13.p1 TRINITY_DN542_c0_g1~~TRINITY_DN542_c0_g1_i13.p1  ORF type:complete len:580 (+),score=152.85 TRINITY_DN542_c0_g1_i13:214-1953(+)
MSETVNPLDLLKEEMDSDEIAVRINAIHRLKIVGTVLGGEAIKAQLLPYLDSLIKKEDDEVLFAIAEELLNLAPMLGQNSVILLPMLENLASVEETVVRDQAIKSLLSLTANINEADLHNQYLPMILRMAGGEWFTSRVSAVNLMPVIYPRAADKKDKIRAKFLELCSEETPMVRRAIAAKIGEFSRYVEKEYIISEFIGILKQLASDEQDSVRVICLDSLQQVAKILNKDENKTNTLPIIIAATEDKSWKVRLALAKNFAKLAEAFGKEITDLSLIQIFTTILRDAENDVRAAAVHSLSMFIKLINNEKLSLLIPHIQALSKDSFGEVRAAIAEVLAALAPIASKELLVKMTTNLFDLLEDEDTHVKMNALKASSKFAEVSGPESFLGPLIPHLKSSFQNGKWRVRVAALETVVDIAVFIQNIDHFTKHLEQLILTYLSDRASAVRECGVKKVQLLAQTYKLDWVYASLFPRLIDILNKDSGYLFKITALHSLHSVSQNMKPDEIAERVVTPLVKYGKDAVPNVKFVVIKILRTLASTKRVDDSHVNSMIKPFLLELTGDGDKDVQFFAQDAVANLQG